MLSNSIKKYFIYLIISALTLISNQLFAQDKIDIKSAKSLSMQEINGEKVNVLKGNVHLRQGETDIYCDEALNYSTSNKVEAKGDVKIKQSNGTVITAEELIYNGDTKIVILKGNVILKDKSMTLVTPELEYNTQDKTAIYYKGGVINDKDSKLISDYGNYNTVTKMFTFKNKVRLYNKEHDLTTDTLFYKTDIKTAFFKGPTFIKTKEGGNLFSTDGEYHTDKNLLTLKGKSQIENTDFILSGDRVLFDNKKKEGEASGHAR